MPQDRMSYLACVPLLSMTLHNLCNRRETSTRPVIEMGLHHLG